MIDFEAFDNRRELESTDLHIDSYGYLSEIADVFGHANTKLTATVLLELSEMIWLSDGNEAVADTLARNLVQDIMFKRNLPESERDELEVFIKLMMHRMIQNYQALHSIE